MEFGKKPKLYHIHLGERAVASVADVQKVYDEIGEAYKELPDNVFPIVDLIPPPDEAA